MQASCFEARNLQIEVWARLWIQRVIVMSIHDAFVKRLCVYAAMVLGPEEHGPNHKHP